MSAAWHGPGPWRPARRRGGWGGVSHVPWTARGAGGTRVGYGLRPRAPGHVAQGARGGPKQGTTGARGGGQRMEHLASPPPPPRALAYRTVPSQVGMSAARKADLPPDAAVWTPPRAVPLSTGEREAD